MVTRKPVRPQTDGVPETSSSTAPPPYPTTPPTETAKMTAHDGTSDPTKSTETSDFDLIDMNEHQAARPRRDSDVSSHGTWDSDDDGEEEEPEDYVAVPKPLNVRHGQQDSNAIEDGKTERQNGLPAILRPGPTGNSSTSSQPLPAIRPYTVEAEENPWQSESNNPFVRQPAVPENHQAGRQDALTWEETQSQMPLDTRQDPPEPVHAPPPPAQAPPPPPTQAPPPPPPPPPPPTSHTDSTFSNHPPVDGMAHLSVAGKAPAKAEPVFETAEVLPVPQQGQPPFPPVTSTPSTDTPVFPSNNPWRMPSPTEKPPQPPSIPPSIPSASPWSLEDDEPQQYEPPPGPPPGATVSLIDNQGSSASPPPQPIRPPPMASNPSAFRSTDSVPETPGTRARRQRNEHYQIKHVNWYDNVAMRRSPILTQNANGPCPLLALVNALVLSTPPNLETALIETLRAREQVSLGLLLDAVFDELMSGRRGDSAHELPDVSELYSFLLALHTGMNVNPRFVTQAATPRGSFDGHPPELHGLHPMHRSQNKPGCFEETREMRLYSTFNVPLIHGWTPPVDSSAYEAFERSAQTFEDAQNVQFAESDLEEKLQNQGLSGQEQQTLQDIQTIKQYLYTWPTQLTEYGLDMISKSMMPGQIAILFRNDHFSTLYKEPKHGALMTLVTDAGYGSHEEIVWESLVDVNGAASEMFSGDFRVVSHGEDVRLHQGSSAGGDQGWQTVDRRQSGRPRVTSGPSTVNTTTRTGDTQAVPPPLPGPRPARTDDENVVVLSDDQRRAAEQEDHDLALALQLQEEEEDRQRQDDQRRRREQELSEQFLENEERPPVPPRRGAGRNSTGAGGTRTSARHAVNRPTDPEDPDAPPSYEQSASDPPYRPAGATAPAQGNPLNAYDALRRQQSAYAQQSTTTLGSNAPPYSPSVANRRQSNGNRIRRRSSGMGAGMPGSPNRIPQTAAQDDRCIIM